MILSLENVTLAAAGPEESAVEGLTLSLAPGQCAWIRAEEETAAVDLACGLRDPGQGVARFEGVDWRARSPRDAARARGRIGRVFGHGAWLSNLDLDENITLARRHLDPEDAGGWRGRLPALCAAFGLELPPGLRPAFASRRDLQRAQWVRALLAEPVLLLLEHPARAAADPEWQAFLAAVGVAREKGAAVVWVGPESARLTADALRPDVTV